MMPSVGNVEMLSSNLRMILTSDALRQSLIRFPARVDDEYDEDQLVGDALVMENVELTQLAAYEDFGLSLAE